MNFQDALEEWRRANEEARVAENVLSRMWQDYIDKRGPAPDSSQITEVNALRRVANDKLARAASAVNNMRP